MAIDICAITHPPYFRYIPAFLSSIERALQDKPYKIHLFSSQTNSDNAKQLNSLVNQTKLSIDLITTPDTTSIGKARNVISRRGKAQWCLFLDTDVTLDERYFEGLESTIQTYEADAYGGGIAFSGASPFGLYEGLMDLSIYLKSIGPLIQQEYFPRITKKTHIMANDWKSINKQIQTELLNLEGKPMSILQGYNQCIARVAFEEVGGFNEQYWSAEDREMALRLVSRGKTISFAPRAIVYHDYQFPLADILKRKRIHGLWYGDLRTVYHETGLLPEMTTGRWVKNALRALNPPHPFNLTTIGRTYYLAAFSTYATYAILSQRTGYNPIKDKATGWTYKKDTRDRGDNVNQ